MPYCDTIRTRYTYFYTYSTMIRGVMDDSAYTVDKLCGIRLSM